MITQLATFVQGDEIKKIKSNTNREGVCLACCVEWLRAVIFNFKSNQQSPTQDRVGFVQKCLAKIIAKCKAPLPDPSEVRMDHLRDRSDDIFKKQVKYEQGNQEGNKLKGYQNPEVAKVGKHQYRSVVLVNQLGLKPSPKDDQSSGIKADQASLTAVAAKFAKAATTDEQQSILNTLGSEVFSPGHPYHIVLVKLNLNQERIHHAVATLSYQGGSGTEYIILFDPNIGELEVPGPDFYTALLRVVGEYGSGAELNTVRYIRIEKGFDFANSSFF